MARTGKCRKEKLPGKLSIAQSSPGKGKEADTDSALGREDGGDALKEPLHPQGSLILVWGCGSCHGMGLAPGVLGLLGWSREQDPSLRAPTAVFGHRATPSLPSSVKGAD